MDDTNKHKLNGDPTAIFSSLKEESENTIDKPKKTNALIKGLKKMSNPLMNLVNKVADGISNTIDMLTKVHFAGPYLIIIAALYYGLLPTSPLFLAWLSFLSGASIALMCFLIWVNESNLDYLHKQKWGIFWIISSQTVVQILTVNTGELMPGQIFGGLATLVSLPLYIYFNMKCEDKNYRNKEKELI